MRQMPKPCCSHVFAMSCFALAFLSAVILSPSLFGQSATTGALTGTVKDSSGAVIPNANVTVTSIATGQARITTTSGSGTYTVGFLAPGNYDVKFEASGFNTVDVPSVTVNVTETPVLDEVLTVGAQSQQVEVRGEAELVQAASSTVGTVVDSETMTATPLTTRNYTNLLGLAAGANVGVFNATNMGRGTQDILVNGSSYAQNNFQQDGASLVDFANTGSAVDSGGNPGVGIVNPDAIAEFKIQTSLFDAGYGRNPGANVNVVTKSGTNQFHGTAFEFFRNTVLNANDFFRKITPPVSGIPDNGRQVLNQNQYGGTFGGPVKRDKLFFFVSYQETGQKNGIAPAGYAIPTLVGIPQGDRSNVAAFKSALGAAFCPGGSAAGTTKATSTVQVACNGSNINPVALNILELKNADGTYYIPSSSTGQNQNVTYSIPAIFNEHQAIGNADYVINAKNTLSGRWFYSREPTTEPFGCAGGVSVTATAPMQCVPGSPGTLVFPTQYDVVKLTSILSTNVVNEARLSVQTIRGTPTQGVPFTDAQVGSAPLIPTVDILDTTKINGLLQWGGTSILSKSTYAAAWEAADQISWSHGKQTIRAGFEFERDRSDSKSPGSSLGALTFTTFQDFLLGLPGCAPNLTTAQCTASGLSGQTDGSFTSNISNTGTGTSIAPPSGLIHYYREPEGNAFVQDDFKILSNLTLNLGLRWEYGSFDYDTKGLNTAVWPELIATVNTPTALGTSAATGSLAGYVVPSNYNFAANPAPPVGGIFQSNQKTVLQHPTPLDAFAPRLGFAWKPLASDRFVVRGGGGYFYDRLPMSLYQRSSSAPPYAVVASQSGAANYFSSEAQPYNPAIALGWGSVVRWANINTVSQTGTTSNINAGLVDPHFALPTTYQWNLNVQYEFLPTWVMEVGYVGSHGIRLESQNANTELEFNEAQLASTTNPVNGITTNTVGNANVRVPYLGFSPSGLDGDFSIFSSKYNALQLTVRKQMSHGLQLQAAYTWARALSTATYDNYNDPYVRYDGPNSFYHPQRFTINYSWDLPLGHHDGFLGKIAGGWNFGGVTVVQDGTPLTIIDTRGGSIYGFGPGAVVMSTAEFAAGMGPANVGTPGTDSQRLGGATGGVGYLNKAAFGLTPVIGNGTGYGNSGMGIILGPGQFNFDMALQKTTKVAGIHEDANLLFRAEAFNLFNHPQFNNPSGSQLDVSNSTFGQITSASVNPRLMQFALKYVF